MLPDPSLKAGAAPSARRRRKAGERGFTLIEVLVALAVLGVVLMTLFRIAGGSLVQHDAREARLRLALTAEAAVALERLEPGAAAQGDWPEGLAVVVERQSFAAAVAGLDGLPDLGPNVAQALDWLVVQVTDEAGGSFTLEAAIAGPAP